MAGQDNRLVDHLDGNLAARNEPVQHFLEAGRFALDKKLERRKLLAVMVEEEGVGFTDAAGKKEHPVRRQDDCIDRLRVRNHDVTNIAGELDQYGLAETDTNVLAVGQAAFVRHPDQRVVVHRPRCFSGFIAAPEALSLCRLHTYAEAGKDKRKNCSQGYAPVLGSPVIHRFQPLHEQQTGD